MSETSILEALERIKAMYTAVNTMLDGIAENAEAAMRKKAA